MTVLKPEYFYLGGTLDMTRSVYRLLDEKTQLVQWIGNYDKGYLEGTPQKGNPYISEYPLCPYPYPLKG